MDAGRHQSLVGALATAVGAAAERDHADAADADRAHVLAMAKRRHGMAPAGLGGAPRVEERRHRVVDRRAPRHRASVLVVEDVALRVGGRHRLHHGHLGAVDRQRDGRVVVLLARRHHADELPGHVAGEDLRGVGNVVIREFQTFFPDYAELGAVDIGEGLDADRVVLGIAAESEGIGERGFAFEDQDGALEDELRPGRCAENG